MSEEAGADSTQNNPQGEDDTQKVDTSKLYSKAYNEGKAKAEKDVLSKFESVTGTQAEKVEDVYSWIEDSSGKLADSISDPTQTSEYKELQKSVNSYKEQLDQAQQRAQAIQNQYKFDSTFTEAVNEIKKASNFKIPQSDVKDLFLAKHDVEYKDGTPVVKKGDTPLLDEEGNYKPLSKALQDFSKSYTEPSSGGTGGGTGDGGGAKPKFADYKEATKNKDYDKVQKLYEQAAQAGGWQESDAPEVG